MLGFLTEHARQTYPFSSEWPSSLSAWNGVFLDAAVGHRASGPDTEHIRLISVTGGQGSTACRISIGTGEDTCLEMDIARGLGERTTLFARNADYRAFVIVNGHVLDGLANALSGTRTVNLPFCMRCVSSSTRRVTRIEAYSSPLCETPVFVGDEQPVVTISVSDQEPVVDAVISAKDGIDAETVTLLPITDEIMRVSAISAKEGTQRQDDVVDVMLRGDECVTVETLGGSKVNEAGEIVPRDAGDPGGVFYGGVIRLGMKCKPCCQCEDYEAAFEALRPANERAAGVKDLLDEARELYDSAVSAFNSYKEQVEGSIDSYSRVYVTASGITSSAIYEDATAAKGLRKRVAITLTVTNMTRKKLSVTAGDDLFSVPGFESVSLSWQTAGSSESRGTKIPQYSPTWRLASGDTLVITGTYAKTGNANDAALPKGTKAVLSLKLPNRDAYQRTIQVA